MAKKIRKIRRTRKYKKKGGGGMEIVYPTFTVSNNKTDVSSTSMVPNIKLNPLRLSTLIMYDPDAIIPSWIHYLVINIPNGDISKGDVVLPYAGPTPPPGTGVHHYIFEQLEQSSPYTTSIQNRGSFDISSFKAQNRLVSRFKKQFLVSS
jgi:phosphatidylethanolamine-binding protein (PEBP) family uncharacterized protein